MTTRDLFTLRMFLIVSELLLPFCFFFTHTSSTEIYTLALHDSLFFFFNDTAPPDISPLPLHAPLPIPSRDPPRSRRAAAALAETAPPAGPGRGAPATRTPPLPRAARPRARPRGPAAPGRGSPWRAGRPGRTAASAASAAARGRSSRAATAAGPRRGGSPGRRGASPPRPPGDAPRRAPAAGRVATPRPPASCPTPSARRDHSRADGGSRRPRPPRPRGAALETGSNARSGGT